MVPNPLNGRPLLTGGGSIRPSVRGTVVLSAAVLVVVGSLGGTVGATTTTIGFEAFDEGTPLTTQYEADGVRFVVQEGEKAGAIVETCTDGNPTCQRAWNGQNAVVTPEENQVTPTGFGTPRHPLVAVFTEPQESVRLHVQDAGDVQGSQIAMLTARNAAGAIVARSRVRFDANTGWHQITVSTDEAVIETATLVLAWEGNSDDPHNLMAVDGLTFVRNEPPSAFFDVTPEEPTVGEAVVLDASAANDPDGEIVEYRWDFDADGTIEGVRQRPTLDATFTEPGTHAVSLVVVDDGGAIDRFGRKITVVGEPTARCSVSETEVQEGQRVVIDASRSDAEVVRFDVDGDGDFDRTNDGSFREVVTYHETGPVQPVVQARIGDQVDRQRCAAITVRSGMGPDVVVGATGGLFGLWVLRRVYPGEPDDPDGDDSDPTAVIEYAPDEPAPGRPVAFAARQPIDAVAGDRVPTYRWMVGDRDATGQGFVHAFPEEGDYDVELRVVAPQGAVDTVTEQVTVEATDGELELDRVHPDAPGDDHRNLDAEYLVFGNAGDDTLDLGGWTVHDTAEAEGRVEPGEHTFTFPEGFELDPDETVTVHTGAPAADDGEPAEAGHLYWDASRAIWNNDGDEIVVEDAGGHPVLAVEYTRTEAGDYELEDLDVEVLESWFPTVVLSRREEAPAVRVSLRDTSAIAVASAATGFIGGAAFLRGPKAFLNSWANLAGYLLSSSIAWAVTVGTGLLPPSIEAIVPVALVTGSAVMVVVGVVGVGLHYVVSLLWGWLTNV